MIIDEEILVLKEVKYKENDKILHALSKTNGKIQLLSRGCKKSNSQLMNISQLFAYSRCSLYKSRDMYIINSAELIDNFYYIRNNIDAFMHGSYILELISYVAQENDVDDKIFYMTIAVLNYFSKYNNEFSKVTAAYELKLASMLGYKPELSYCLSCSKKISEDSIFSIEEGGTYCTSCSNYVKFGNGINITYKEILCMKSILKTKFKDLSSIDGINDRVLNIIRRFLHYYIGKSNFTTIKLL